MKKVPKWLLAGGILAVAFACQCQSNDQIRPNQNKGDCGGCGAPKPMRCTPEKCEQPKCQPKCCPEPPKEKPCPKPVCEPKNRSCGAENAPVEKSGSAAAPEAEKLAAPITVPAIRVAEQEAPLAKKKGSAPSLNESKDKTAVSSVPSAPAPAPEAKNAVSSSAPAKPVVPAVKDQTATTSSSK